MAFRLENTKQLSKYLSDYIKKIDKAVTFRLEAYVAELQNHAKDNAGYADQTSNLKGSIGGVVLRNGKPVSYAGFDTDGSEGNAEGLEFINQLISEYSKGYVILLVAGMEYAAYVEDIYNLNVLKKSELKMNRELSAIMEKLKSQITRAA